MAHRRKRAGIPHFIAASAALIVTNVPVAHASPILQWGNQNADFGTLALDASNNIFTGQGNNQGTGSLSRYTSGGSFVLRKNFTDTTRIPRTATASGPGAIYGTGNYTTRHITRYDSLGNVVWSRTGTDFGINALAGNSTGVLAAGATSASLAGTHQGGGDGYAIKYDPDGNFIWHAQFGGSMEDRIWGAAMDSVGNAYFGGYTWGAITSPNLNTPHVGGTPSDAFVMSYNNNGNFRWGKQFGTTTGDAIYAVATDPLGNVIVVGDTHASLTGPHLGGADIIVRKYDTNGNVIWSKQLGSSSDDRARAVTTDAQGNIFIGAYTGGSIAAANVPYPSGAPSFDALVGMLSPQGDVLWWYQRGSNAQDTIAHIAVGSNGSVYVEGNSFGQLFPAGAIGEDFVFALQIPEPATGALIMLPLALLRRHRRTTDSSRCGA